MATLYELSAQFNQVVEMLQEEDFNEAIIDTLEAIDLAIEDKAENYAKVVRELEGQAELLKNESQRLSKRKTMIDNNIKRLKENLQNVMEETGKTKIKGDLFTISIQNNPTSLKVTDETKIPLDFFIPQPSKLDKETLKIALKGGEVIEGAHLSQGRGLRIR